MPTTPTKEPEEPLPQAQDKVSASPPSEEDYHTLNYPIHAWGQRVKTRNQRNHSKRLITSIIDQEVEEAQAQAHELRSRTRSSHVQGRSRVNNSTRKTSYPSSYNNNQDSSRASTPYQPDSSHEDWSEVSTPKRRTGHRKGTAAAAAAAAVLADDDDDDSEYRPMKRDPDSRRTSALRTRGQRTIRESIRAEVGRTKATNVDSNSDSPAPAVVKRGLNNRAHLLSGRLSAHTSNLKSKVGVERVECVLIPVWKKQRGKPRAEDTKSELQS